MAEIYVFLVGLVVGSFLNVVIHRLPRGESLVRPGSHCPHCGHALGATDLIPVLSFLVVRGKCRYCRGDISWQYPLVETVTGLSFLLIFLRHGMSPASLALMIYVGLLIAIAGIDWRTMIIPDVLSLPGIGIGLLHGLIAGDATKSLLGAVVGGGSLLVAYLTVLILLKKEGLGLGDAKLLAMIGAFLGWQGAFFAIFLGSLLGSLIGVALILGGCLKRGVPMPFGPYLAFAGLLLALWPWEVWLGPLVGLKP